MWQVPQVQQLKVRLHLYNVDLDQCQFGSAFRKPTRILVSNAQFLALALKCRGDHPHTVLKGRLRLRSGEVVFMTKLAQEYPSEFCKAFAQVTKSVVDHTLPQFRPSFQLLAPRVDRKRRIDDPVTWKGQRVSAETWGSKTPARCRMRAGGGSSVVSGHTPPLHCSALHFGGDLAEHQDDRHGADSSSTASVRSSSILATACEGSSPCQGSGAAEHCGSVLAPTSPWSS